MRNLFVLSALIWNARALSIVPLPLATLFTPVTVSWFREEGDPENWFFKKQFVIAPQTSQDFVFGTSEPLLVQNPADNSGTVVISFTSVPGTFRLLGFGAEQSQTSRIPFFTGSPIRVMTGSQTQAVSSQLLTDVDPLSTKISESLITSTFYDSSSNIADTALTASPTHSDSNPGPLNQKSNKNLITGSVIGSIFALILICTFAITWVRRRKRHRASREATQILCEPPNRKSQGSEWRRISPFIFNARPLSHTSRRSENTDYSDQVSSCTLVGSRDEFGVSSSGATSRNVRMSIPRQFRSAAKVKRMEKSSQDDGSHSVHRMEVSDRSTEILHTENPENSSLELPPVQAPSLVGWMQNRRRRQPNIVRHFDSGIRVPQAAGGRREELDTEEDGEVFDEVINLPPEYSAA